MVADSSEGEREKAWTIKSKLKCEKKQMCKLSRSSLSGIAAIKGGSQAVPNKYSMGICFFFPFPSISLIRLAAHTVLDFLFKEGKKFCFCHFAALLVL